MQGNPEYIDRSSRPGAVSDVSNATSRQVHQRPQPSAPQSRILSLDVIRGIAVAGILLVNTPNLLRVDAYTAPGHPTLVRHLLDLFVQERFFPIFSFLFGISFAIVLTGAMQRSNHPRVVLLRRLIALLVLGVIHSFSNPVRRFCRTPSADLSCCYRSAGSPVGGPLAYALSLVRCCC